MSVQNECKLQLWEVIVDHRNNIAFKLVGPEAYSDNSFFISFSLLPYIPYTLSHFCSGVGLFLKTESF